MSWHSFVQRERFAALDKLAALATKFDGEGRKTFPDAQEMEDTARQIAEVADRAIAAVRDQSRAARLDREKRSRQ